MQRVSERILELLKNYDDEGVREVLLEVATQRAISVVDDPLQRPNTKVSPKEVWDRLLVRGAEVAENLGEDFSSYLLTQIDKIGRDLGHVMDFENAGYEESEGFGVYKSILGPRYFGKIPAVGCYAGGDWEFPVFFLIFLEEDGKTLRAYIPKEGNIWNYDSKEAFGNNEDSDRDFLLKWFRENRPTLRFDPNNISIDDCSNFIFNKDKIAEDAEKHFGLRE